ncbi:MAG: EamA-like transporter family protein [Pseudonocardiaceae bacterium]|nr:EamA-like transporter family protein [Pseudonocardiaceae bacterium]
MPTAAGLLAAVAVGTALAAQARINGELGGRIDDGVVAALLSFAGGELVLLALAATVPAVRAGLARTARGVRSGRLPWWQLLGGLCGAFLVITQGLTVGVIGVAVFTVAVVAGQATSSLVVDRAGLGPGAAQPVTVTRIAGAVLTIAAVVLAVSDRLGTPAALWIAVIPVLAGITVAWQQAVNGRVNTVAGNPLAATLVNFTVGIALLLVVAAVEVAVRGLPGPLPSNPVLYLGGPLGIVFIATAVTVVRLTGVLLLGLGTIAGQLVGALLLDVFVPVTGEQLTATAVAGTALTLVAMAVAALPSRRL